MLQPTDLIVSARIKPAGVLFSGDDVQAIVFVKVQGSDEEHVLFKYYDDELTFTASEFVGKTVNDAHEFRVRRADAYLRS